MKPIFSTAFIALTNSWAGSSPTGQQIAQYVHTHLSNASEVYFPCDSNYSQAVTQRWNTYQAPSYRVAVKPALPSDVQKLVRYAHQNSIPILGTGGGHGYTTTLSTLRDGMDIDLGNFHNVDIDDAADTMTVGGSVRFSDITGPLQSAGKEFPVGACSCIGLLGAALGGGVGAYGSMYGVISDSLLSVEMVIGAGELITVSDKKHKDLFWAVKGAGHNYGIVTSATFKIYNATNGGNAIVADLLLPASANGSVWQILSDQVGMQPKELTYQVGAAYNQTLGQTLLVVNLVYVGAMSSAQRYVQPLLDLNPLVQNVRSVAYRNIQDQAIFGATVKGCVKGNRYSEHAVNLYKMDVSNLIATFDFFSRSIAANKALQAATLAFTQFSQHGFQLYDAKSSAFPFRNLVTLVELDGLFLDPSEGPAMVSFGRSLQARFQNGAGSASLEVYVNYAHGDEGPAAWYGAEKLPKLRKLKRRYDPYHLFSYYCPVTGRSGDNA